MADVNMFDMKNAAVIGLPRGDRRGQRPAVRAAVPIRTDLRRAGRAWINGREVGGTEGRFAHLDTSHD